MSETIKYSDVSEQLLAKLNQKWVERLKASKDMATRVALFRGYDIQTPEEEKIIQFFVSKIDPPKSSVTTESLVRAELEAAEAKGVSITDPALEAEWEKKIATAREADRKSQLEEMAKQFTEIKSVLGDIVTEEDFFGSMAQDIKAMGQPEKEKGTDDLDQFSPVANMKKQDPVTPPAPAVIVEGYPEGVTPDTDVSDMKWIGAAILEKLNANNIFSASQFFALTYDQAVEICKSPLTPTRYKKYFQSSQAPQLI
jgi:hypothetical protein